MTPHRMRLVGADGDVTRAWLDASRLSPDYDGIRCVLAIGEEGGVVCVAVEGWSGTDEAALRQVATEAVVAVEMSVMKDHPDVPLTDKDGRSVEIDPGEDDTAPIDDDVAGGTERHLRHAARRLPTPWAPMALMAIGIAAVAWILTYADAARETRTIVVLAVTIGLSGAALTLVAGRPSARACVLEAAPERAI